MPEFIKPESECLSLRPPAFAEGTLGETVRRPVSWAPHWRFRVTRSIAPPCALDERKDQTTRVALRWPGRTRRTERKLAVDPLSLHLRSGSVVQASAFGQQANASGSPAAPRGP